MKKKTGGRLSLRGGCFGSWAWKKEKAPWKRKLVEGCPCAEVVLDQLVEHSLCNTGPRSHQHVLQKQNQWERIYCHQYLLKKLCINGKKCDLNNAGKTSFPIFLTKICHFFTDMSVISVICSMSDGNIHCQKEKEVDDQIKGTVSGPLKRAREWYLRWKLKDSGEQSF